MFNVNKNFYPTPGHLIDKMLSGLDFDKIHSILEPSAGKGDIVEALKKEEGRRTRYCSSVTFDVDCIEIDQNLQYILKGKKFRVVNNDFLTYDTMKEYDLIIMNPPFDNGCKHLLKALEMQKRNGGAIVCLLNAETLRNSNTNNRITLSRQLDECNAKIEYIQDAFMMAERKTSVEVALIKVQLPEIKRQSFIFEGLKKAKYENNSTYTEKYYLVENDLFKSIVNQFKLEVEAGIKLIKEYKAMCPLIMTSFAKDEKTGDIVQRGGCMLSMHLLNGDNNTLSINDFINEVRRKYWHALFENPKFIGQLTNNLRQDFYNRLEDIKEYEFSLFNIYQLKVEMSKKVIKGIEDTITSLFDELSNKHHYYDETSKNIHYYSGWKTNKAYIINKKVIIPLNGYYDLCYSWGSFKPTNKKVIEKLQDMEKCFNYLDGGLTEAIDLESSLKFAEEYGETKNIELKYFTVTFYKKGTCHITFTNDELLKKFNIFGSQHKGWLPPCYGKKNYKDMSTEEKQVVNEFEGESEYSKVIKNTSYYLFDENKLNLLEDKTV